MRRLPNKKKEGAFVDIDGGCEGEGETHVGQIGLLRMLVRCWCVARGLVSLAAMAAGCACNVQCWMLIPGAGMTRPPRKG